MKITICACLCLALLFATTASAQSPVQGTVTNESGPMQGVSVVVKHTGRGVQTDASGRFSIQAASGDTLVFSFSGYSSYELAVDGRSSYDISLAADVQSMENVVVIGYGTKKRQFLTGAVSTVGAEVFRSRPITNTLSGMQGAVPGMVIQRSSGQPGTEGFDLNVRGFSSTGGGNTAGGGNTPLVLVDGVAGSLDLLNPEDIESISVLKDASASIYGARAANGVVIVTTKKGNKGAPRISYNNNFAITKLSGIMESPTNYEMAIMDNEANIHNGAAPMYTPDLLERIRNNDPNPIPHPIYGGWMLFFTNTDWVDALFTNGFQQKHNINVSGGGTNSSYYLSGSFLDQRGVIRYAEDNNKRYNLRLNYDYDFTKRIRLESKIALEHQKRTDIGGLGSWVITEGIFGMPNHPVYSSDGKFFAQGGWGNAVAQAKEAETATFNTRNINTNFKLIATIVNGLRLNLQTGINYRTDKFRDIGKPVPLYNWEGQLAYYTIANPGESWIKLTNQENLYKNFTGYLEYNKMFAGRHDVGVMVGASHEENDFEWFSASRQNIVSDDVWSINLGTGDMTTDGRSTQWALRSVFSRISYAFDNKYLFEANLRYDGSSRFHPDHRWGLFPGFSAGWRISQESFMRKLKFINDLKLRASYGETGNQDVVGLYDYIQQINIGGSYPFGQGSQSQSASLSNAVSLERSWETLGITNIGLDAAVLSSRLSFSFDYFIKRNKDMLIPIAYPSLMGAVAPYTNSGELKTWGFETSVNWADKIGKLSYSARVILSDAQNEIVYYGGIDRKEVGLNSLNVWPYPPPRQGYPLDAYYAYVFDGVIRTQKELDDYKLLGGVPSDIGIGDARFKDVNGDGKISIYGDTPGDEGDVIYVGNTTPRFNFGINLGARYSNFDISIFIQGVGKRTLFRTGEYSMPWSDWWRQPPRFYYGKTWNEDRPDAEYPRLSHGNIRYWNYQPSTLQKINAAYARLKNLQIGYTLPQTLIRKTGINQARIYFSGQDLFEIHNVKGGWDPEGSSNGFNYPFQRFYSFGIDVTL